jgi:excisionase family DNA binding protein
MELPQLLTLAEVCKKLRISRNALMNEITQCRIEGIKVGRQWRFRPSAVEAYLKSRSTSTKKPVAA